MEHTLTERVVLSPVIGMSSTRVVVYNIDFVQLSPTPDGPHGSRLLTMSPAFLLAREDGTVAPLERRHPLSVLLLKRLTRLAFQGSCS